MILLTVKISEDALKNSSNPGDFERAWYRLVNGETSQTIDYKLIKDVQGPDVPQADDTAAADDAADGDDGVKKTTTYTYIAGRIFFDHRGNGRWVYESYNNVFSSERFD